MSFMNRSTISLSLLATLVAAGAIAAQPKPVLAEPGASFVGVWSLINADPQQAPTLLTINADGTFITSQVAGGGNTPIQGVWEPTGERRMRLTGKWLLGDNKTFTFMGSGKLTGDVVLNTNSSFHAEATIEGFDAQGKRMFVGPTVVKGFRIRMENQPKN